MSLFVAGSGAHFDPARNSSKGAGVMPTALPNALKHLASVHDEEWYRWVLARHNGQHLHGTRRRDGSPSACPVRGCPH